MATGLPIPKEDTVLPQPAPVVGAGAYSVAQAWLNIAESNQRAAAANEKVATAGASLASSAIELGQYEKRNAETAQIAAFEVDWRRKRTEARDQFSMDPEGFRQWADAQTEGALSQVPGWMLPHAKQFLSREFDGAYGSILSERRARDNALDREALTARVKMADDDVMSIASSKGNLDSVEGQSAIVTHQAILDSAVATGAISKEQAQLIAEDLTTRAHATMIRNDVEQTYREKGYDAARARLDETLEKFGAQYKVKDKIRTQTLGWLRSEEAGMRGERDAMGRDWAAAKPNLATLSPEVLVDMQNRAYAVGAYRVGDDIQAHVTALNIARQIRQLPQADQVRVLASGNFDARLTQRESGGDPTKVNQLGFAGAYQFGAPRLAALGVYTPGPNESMGAWSKTPSNAPGKWSGTFSIPGFPEVKSLSDFLANPGAQKAAYGLHQQRMDREIDELGLGQYIGQTVGGVPITRDGIKAMIHLGGAAGARATLASGGGINPRDENGTSLLDYARMGVPGDLTQSRGGLIAMNMLRKDLTQDLGKKITDFQSAVNKTEFPPMEEVHALVAQVGFLGNEEQKRQVAEMAAQVEYGKRFMALPPAQREEIKARWMQKVKDGATQYERHLADVVQSTDRRITEEFKKDPYGAAYRFTEGLNALPAIDWASPTAGQLLTAKVAQQNTIRVDQNMEAFSALRPGEATALASQLVNGDARQSKAIIGMLATALPDDIYKATIGDAPIRAALDGMVRSYDPDKLDLAMSVLDRAQRLDPIGFKDTFKGDTERRLQTWQAHKDSLPPIAMAEHFRRVDDPAFAAARKHLEQEADGKLSGTTPAKVANELGSAADRWVPFVNHAPPVDPLQAGALAAEYTLLFKERYVDTQDVSKANAQAVERLRTVWGPSTVAGGALMRHPPERYYPQVDGSHDWMKRDVESAIAASRLGAGTREALLPGVTPDIPGAPLTYDPSAFTYRVVSDARTEADIAAKRPPSYVVMVKDIASGRDTIPLDWAGQPMRFTFDPANARAAVAERFTTEEARRRELIPGTVIGAP